MTFTDSTNHPANRRIPARVLIVEATEVIGQTCLNALKKVERLDPRRVLGETAALEQIRAWHPQLLIVGDKLAGESGLQFCQTVRESSSVPIVFLTSQGDVPHQLQCLNTGADDCIVYPFEEPLLISHILCLLRRAYRYSRPLNPEAPRGAAQFLWKYA